MPGLFGAVGVARQVSRTLAQEYSLIWGESESVALETGMLGGHAFGLSRAVLELKDGTLFAVDGEASIYRSASTFAAEQGPPLFTMDSDGFRLTEECHGNVAAVDSASGCWFIGATPLGSFPLYYTQAAGGLVFSSLLRPLAKAVGRTRVPPDMVGAIQWLRRGTYLYGRRTFFQGVHRLLPGQVLCFDPNEDRLIVRETSDLWTAGYDARVGSPSQAAELCWTALASALRSHSLADALMGLMMSGGWDSRLLFGGLRSVFGPAGFVCWCHGDPKSREISIVRRLCEASGVQVHFTDSARAHDTDALEAGFRRVERVTGPEWLYAGRAFAEMGVEAAVAGIYGEIIGGDQGPDDLQRGLHKIPALARGLLAGKMRGKDVRAPDISVLRDAFAPQRLTKPWYLSQAAWSDVPNVSEMITADLELDLARLIDRGIEDHNQLLEAFLVETRQAQFTVGQLLACRVAVDVSIPYGDWKFARLVSRIPWEVKFHRNVMRRILERYSKNLLKFPVAASLVPAGAPILLQEAARFVRRADERMRWRVHHASRGLIPFPRYGWLSYEFLRDGEFLNALVEDLRCDFWDKPAIQRRVTDALSLRRRSEPTNRLEAIRGDLLRISTIDRMLR